MRYGMMDDYSFALCYRTLAEEVEATEDPVQDAEDNEEDTEEEMDMEFPLSPSTSAIKMSTKKIMEEAGLHKKHSADSQLLQGFRSRNVSRVTAINYMSGVKIFFSYVTSEDQLLVEDPSLSGSISNFFKNITEVQKSICRGAGKEKTCTNPRECQEVLTLANSFFGEVIDRANSRNELQERDMTSMLFYLEALLILQHLQRPSVIQYMTVQQWLERTWYQSRSRDSVRAAVIKVKAATHPIVVFNEVEEMWFDTYFRFVRPAFMKRSSSGDKGYFFVSSKGSKIQNLTTDVHRFQERFNACLATGKEVLHIFEKVIICESTSEDQELIKIYLSSDFNKSNISEYMRATMRVSELQRTWEQPSNSRLKLSGKEVAYKTVENAFKVDLDSKGPTLKECCKFTEMHGKYCFDRWRRQQTKCRLDAVIGKNHSKQKPTASQVLNYLKLQGWSKHVPSVEEILLHWEAREQPRREGNDSTIQSLVTSQKWPGLAIVDDPDKGQKKVTINPFQKGDYICGYRGPIISAKEGEQRMRSVEQEKMVSLYFFMDRGNKRCCIDAQNVPCPCHSELATTYGRKINHSRKRPNLKPMVKYFENDTRPHILFIANKDIDVGTSYLIMESQGNHFLEKGQLYPALMNSSPTNTFMHIDLPNTLAMCRIPAALLQKVWGPKMALVKTGVCRALLAVYGLLYPTVHNSVVHGGLCVILKILNIFVPHDNVLILAKALSHLPCWF
uniref:SET domain-containing protein n=1 Tax=Xenopus tropicalis TaxID=8364 RepID=A0A6I8PTN7_XENTR